MAQRFDAHGFAQGGVFVLHDVASLDDDRAKVAFLTDGRLVATWRTRDPDNTHAGAIFDTDGTRHDFAFTANNERFTANPEITATADGGFAITWNGYHAETYNTDILIQRFDSNGNPVAQGAWPSPDGDQRLTGTAGNDIIDGGTGNDTLNGGAGNDLLRGHDGDDVIFGGAGWDKIYGGDGNDLLRGQRGNDDIQGGAGDDTIYGNRGRDTVSGQDGADTIFGGRGRDSIDGGDGNDLLHGGQGADTIQGGAHDDTIDGGDGRDRLIGGTGNDVMTGGTGNDSLQVGDGIDALHGGAGLDHLSGGSGQDVFIFMQGDDTAIIHDFSVLQEDLLILDDAFITVGPDMLGSRSWSQTQG